MIEINRSNNESKQIDNESIQLLRRSDYVDYQYDDGSNSYDSIVNDKQQHLQYNNNNDIDNDIIINMNTVQCTVFETSCNLISVLTGSGMLALPYAAAQIGWIAIPLLLLLGCIFLYSFHLIAQSIETRYKYINATSQPTYIPYDLSHYQIDYLHLSKLAFGYHGDRIVLVVLSLELFLAQVTFYMSIGM
jgi:hypothetical protein